jgi:phosphatidate cytidylyltransferase
VKQRVITALVLAPLAIAAVLFLPTSIFMVLMAAALLLGLWEWSRLIGFESHATRAVILLAHAAAMALLAWKGWPGVFPFVALAGVAWWCLAALWLIDMKFASAPTPRNRVLKLAIGSLLVLPAWCAAGMLHGDVGMAGNAVRMGPAWTLYALAIVWAADSGAYFVGSRVGGPKMSPSISPGKTWSGFGGGLATVIVLACVCAPLFGLGWNEAPLLLLASVLAGLASVVGDLFESIVKRHAGAKDSGYLFPGHGGVLDRIDSLTFTAPLYFHLLAFFALDRF